MSPRISLAIPVFNGENYLRLAIDSILAQDFHDFELIITDNASTDGTQAICEEAAAGDSRIRYHRNPRNLGAAPNYNRGYELARGEFLKWCAHDDLLSPNYLSACLRVLAANPDAALAFGATQCIDLQGNPAPWDVESEMGSVDHPDPAQRFYEAVTRGGTCFPIFGLFRKDMLDRTTLHRTYYGSDRALIAEAALLGKVLQVPDAIFFNREHPTRSINMNDLAARSRWQNASASRRTSMEHVNLLTHLLEIAVRHPDVVPRHRGLRVVGQYASAPVQLGRYALDLVRYVSPQLGAGLKDVVKPVFRQISWR